MSGEGDAINPDPPHVTQGRQKDSVKLTVGTCSWVTLVVVRRRMDKVEGVTTAANGISLV